MFYTCEVRTFDQGQTHSRSAVGFSLRFGLVTLENSGIDHKIIGVAWVRSWYRNYFLNHFTILYMNKSSLLVKITYILVSTSHAKFWPFKYWWSALSSKVCKKIRVRPWWRSCVCVCVCACTCTYTMCQERTLCMFYTCEVFLEILKNLREIQKNFRLI